MLTYYHVPGAHAEPMLIDNEIIIKQLEKMTLHVGDQVIVEDLLRMPLEVVDIKQNMIIFKWIK
ncbi:MAG: hypothetical protein ACRDDX_09355 [Cellulosilyticaceae bacterium]